jgi:hypothetical protein
MDQVDESLLVVLKDIENIVGLLQVGPKMGDGLAGEVVKQCGMVVVRYVVEVDEAANEVVLGFRLRDDSIPAHETMLLHALEVLD